MRAILAFDSFKGCLTADAVCEAAAAGFLPDDRLCLLPLSDGGEGFARLLTQNAGGQWLSAPTQDPLGRPILAGYGLIGDTAVIEVAAATGLGRLRQEERDPLQTSSYGTGLLIANAIGRGCKQILLGLGGSATNDGGAGLVEAVGDLLRRHAVGLTACYDTEIRFAEATALYGPQKGVNETNRAQVEQRMRDLERRYGPERMQQAGTGAAGGIGGAVVYLGGRLKPGADVLLDQLHFETLIRDLQADLILTGEGCFDRQTLTGKLPLKVALRASVPVYALAGKVMVTSDPHFQEIIAVTPEGTPPDVALRPDFAQQQITRQVRLLRQRLA